eukprot:gnl/MRDRNA2_/MRDRNA2_110819_c0_seq1.p1 gnl/MRDRNA2_/MRDRNA2_110819_c0~~gnl/MRDRNA2_/MRDRNA2_110819_c0_seq1.p1  ORF type:complete len:347 (+),score=60.06 gnl/MRDRNA2_/MRDRNA2_110819_c0_seq1:89-1129(+)
MVSGTESKGPETALDKTTKDGSFQRSSARHRIGDSTLITSEAGRYHLHVALACPWACGTLSMLYLKGLENVIGVSIVHPTWQKTKNDESDKHYGWVFRNPGEPPLSNSNGYGAFDCDDALIPDTVTNCRSIREVYEHCGDFVGPFTTPVLYDKKENKIVSNESMDILRILNSSFNDLAKHPAVNLYPDEPLAAELQKLNADAVYPFVNNGVYRCGFAKSQKAYDDAVSGLFTTLEELDSRLSKSRFLVGDTFTWLDLRLFHTLVRFDSVYVVYFKTNEKRIADFPNLINFVRDVYSMKSIQRSINMKHIKMHYFTSHPQLNFYGIIPVSDGPDFNVAHGRSGLSKY